VEDAADLSTVATEFTLGKRQSRLPKRYDSASDSSEDLQPVKKKGS